MDSAQFQLHAEIEERHWWFVARRKILCDVVRAIAPPSGRRDQIVVDIGCGTGGNLAALSGDYRCVGVDTSAEAIELAKARFSGITFLCGEAPGEVRPWLARADVVLLTDVLEHVFDDRGLLESIVETCSPGAKVVMTVPADMRLWSPHDTAFGHYRRYDSESLRRVWAGLPVRMHLLTHFNRRLFPAVRIARAMSRFRGRASGVANTDFRLPIPPINRLLERIFAGESNRLLKSLGRGETAYRSGVSLLAVLEKLAPVAPEEIASVEGPKAQKTAAPTQLQAANL